jgi:hypothetical protein
VGSNEETSMTKWDQHHFKQIRNKLQVIFDKS